MGSIKIQGTHHVTGLPLLFKCYEAILNITCMLPTSESISFSMYLNMDDDTRHMYIAA